MRIDAIDRTGIEYYCQVSDVQMIKSIVRSLPDNPRCVNIGAGMGTSALAMLEARNDAVVISIDIDDECLKDEKELIESLGMNKYNRYFPINMQSQVYGHNQEAHSVDFVFIDGGHKYDECYKDAIAWYKPLKVGGIMAFHDYESAIRVLESVKRAVDDVVKVLKLRQINRQGTLIVFRKETDEDIPYSG